jgi:hypothetical protein
LIRISWLKKIWNGRSKGISTVLGTVFLTLVVFAISTNVFLWTLSRNAEYTLAVKEENQKNIDRMSEYVSAAGANYSVLGEDVTITARITNAGSVAVQIINIWVFDTTQQTYANVPVELSLNPGQASDYIVIVEISGANASHEFVSWFVTARGNTVPLQTEQDVILAQVSQGIGSLSLDFNVFRYFFYNSSVPQKLADYPTGIMGFNIPRTPEIAFGITLRNLDPLHRVMILNEYSQAWLYFPKSPGQSLTWHIMNVSPDGTIVTPYTPISLAFGESKLFIFASKDPSIFGKVSIPAAARDLPCALNLLLLGTIGFQDYGQNIPFVSTYVTE